MPTIIKADFSGTPIQFTSDAWFNATAAAARFGKEPYAWLRRDDVRRFVQRLCEIHKTRQTRFIRTRRGKGVAGTWLHPKLAVKFAQWLSVDFEIWCSEQIDHLIRGEIDAKRARHISVATAKLMAATIHDSRDALGKPAQSHHYSNEHRLINWCLTGKFGPLDRDNLSFAELDQLAKLETRNAQLIAAGVPYEQRKEALQELTGRREIACGGEV